MAGVKVAGGRVPRPALPPAPAELALGAEPDAVLGPAGGEVEEIGIGRSRLRDGKDAGQNSAFAAAIVQAVSSGIAR